MKKSELTIQEQLAMQMIFLAIYIVPATALGVGIWMILRILRELGAGVMVRRICFVFLATILLAPSIVPAGIIMTAIVPNGLLALSGELPMLHQPGLVKFAIWSFSISAIVAALLASRIINNGKSRSASPSGRKRLARIAIPVGLIGILLSLYYAQIPDRKIPEHIGWELVESSYGAQMDAVVATLAIEDHSAVVAERERLRELFQEDPVVKQVTFRDRRLDATDSSSRLFFTREMQQNSSRSCSSVGDGKYRNDRLMRCGGGLFGTNETLTYRRDSWIEGQNNRIEIEFDYSLFLDRYPTSVATNVLVDMASENKTDERVVGTWSMKRRVLKAPNEDRLERAILVVGLRGSSGHYTVSAVGETESTLMEGGVFGREACDNGTTVCKWSTATTGSLNVQGSQIQIVYDNIYWMDPYRSADRLELRDGVMSGRDDFGTSIRFERVIDSQE